MAIIVHGPGVADPVRLDRLPREGGPERTQPTAPVAAISDDEQSPSRQAAERLRAAIRAAGERGGSTARALRAGMLMQDAVYALGASMPLTEAREALHARELYQAPVVDDEGRLTGLLGLADLLRLAWPPGELPRPVDAGMTVGEACRKPVDALREDTPLEVIVRLMLDRGYAAMPVVDDEGKVIGMVGMRDLLRGLLGMVRLEAWA
ncbi:MAG: CBS domain-containing protein [Halothiobacillaceae bacterium]|nr:MAG: CBS domain-containing protein [Halothiobacillaceae bacterium]